METKENILNGLSHFYGTETYHRWSPLFRNMVLTDGVQWLCANAECYWLVDAIASHQPTALKHRNLKQAQYWTLKVNPDSSALLTCNTGAAKAKPVITQKIDMTTFPLDSIELYCMPNGDGTWVILLPSEY